MMAPEAEIYDYRVFGAEGWRVDRAVAESIMQAVEDGCDVINMSLGGPRASWRIGNAVKFAYSQGVPMIVAAGNEGDNNPLTNERRYDSIRLYAKPLFNIDHIYCWILINVCTYISL